MKNENIKTENTNNRGLAAFSIILLSVLCVLPLTSLAEGASLNIYPQSGSFTIGSTFDASVFLNTGFNSVNAVQVNLKFDPAKIRVVTPAKGLSSVTNWTFQPSFSNTEGRVALIGGFGPRGISTSEGLVSVIIFEAVSSGQVDIYFEDSSKVLLADEKGTNILSSANRAQYEILPVPSKGPKIFSETHPDQNAWYKNNNPSLFWQKNEGDSGYGYKIDEDPFGEPENKVVSESAAVSFENLKDGPWYFHLKTKKGDVWGGTSHFRVMIDNSPPLEFEPYFETAEFAGQDSMLIYFSTQDPLSGIDHYESRIVDLSNAGNIVFSGWFLQESPFRFNQQNKGAYEILIRAFDKAGNFREEKIRLRLINSSLVLAGAGIRIKGFYFLWWQIILLFVPVFLVILGLLFFLGRGGRRDAAVRLAKEIKEAEKEIEDVRKIEIELKRLRGSEETVVQEWHRLKNNLEEEIK